MIGRIKEELEMTKEKLFTLYHGDENNREIVSDNIKDWKQLWEEMPKFLKTRNFKSRYYRQWIIKDVLYIDYGSWTNYLMIDAEIIATAEDITLLKKLKRSE